MRLPGVRPVPGTPGWPGSTTTSWAPAAAGPGRSGRLAAVEPQEEPPEACGPDQPASPDQLALQETVNGLEYELATAWSKHGKLAEENVRLREQLRAAQRSLALAAEQVRSLPAGTDLNSREVVVLQRLLTAAPSADSADDSGAEAPSLLA